jgi:hypothetical protein
VKNGKGLTVVEDSDVSTQVSVKRLSPPISKRQKEKVNEPLSKLSMMFLSGFLSEQYPG